MTRQKRNQKRFQQHPSQKHSRRHSKKQSFTQDKQHKYQGQSSKLKATVDKNRRGFAFLIFEKKELEDLFVSPRDAENLFHGDRVEVVLDSRGRLQRIQVLEHRFREIVGHFSPLSRGYPERRSRHPQEKSGWVIYERKNTRLEIFIPRIAMEKEVQPDDWVRAKLHFHEKGPHGVTGEILEIYGQNLPPSADVGMIAAEYNLIEKHSKAAEHEARQFRLEIPGKDEKGRADLRHIPFVTIDGETARDFDDAVFVEKKKSGYILWVAIADVSHYVKEGTPLDEDARSRGTSVYFPERAFHMLPRALSENLCSLRPHEARLSLVAKMEMDRHGNRIKTDVLEAIIESKRRATYNEIQSEWEQHQKDSKWEFAPHFELYRSLRKMRTDRGSIDFELPEAEVVVDASGDVISIRNRDRKDSHRLIEEFMIAANEGVTEWMMSRGWPFVYRVHEEPSFQSLTKFKVLAATVGFQVTFEGKIQPKVLADIARQLEDHPAQALLNMALLRSMKQAIYSAEHGIHYGLASPAYTHFTSPIRRYPDLVVHRLLRMAIRVESKKARPLKDGALKKLERELVEVCEHCSYRERLAADAEREAIRLKQVRAAAKRLGEEFDAKVSGMVGSGLFVQIEDPFVEGLLSVDLMTDDDYIFNEERMIFYGRRKKRTFKIGDILRVKVIRADLDRRQIDFAMV